MFRFRSILLRCMLVLLIGDSASGQADGLSPSQDTREGYYRELYLDLPLALLISAILSWLFARLLATIADCYVECWTVSRRSLFNPDDRPRGSYLGPYPAVAQTLADSVVKERRNARSVPECAICLGEFEDDEEVLRPLPGCLHLFHAECIDAWLLHNPTCPLCRARIIIAESARLGRRRDDSRQPPRTEPATRERLHPSDSTSDHVVVDVIS